jgi:hypothetical protein
MYRTYIWFTAMCPSGPRSPNSTRVCSIFSPPTKKLPCAFSTKGESAVCRSLSDCAFKPTVAPTTKANPANSFITLLRCSLLRGGFNAGKYQHRLREPRSADLHGGNSRIQLGDF